MGFEKQKRKNDDEAVFYLKNRVGCLDFFVFPYAGIIILFGGSFVAMAMNTVGEGSDVLETMSVLACGFSLVFPLLVILVTLMGWTRLKWTSYIVIRPNGIEWVRGGISKLNISWDMMQDLQTRRIRESGPSSRTYTVVDVRLYTIVMPETHNWLARSLYGHAIDTIPLSKYIDVPITYIQSSHESLRDKFLGVFKEQIPIIDMEKFKQTLVGSKFFQNAPHLFPETLQNE